jgi:hypothetical protein
MLLAPYFRPLRSIHILYLLLPRSMLWRILWRTRHYQALPHAPVFPVKDLRDIVGVARHGKQLVFRDTQGATVTKL